MLNFPSIMMEQKYLTCMIILVPSKMNDSNIFLKKYLDEQSSCLVSLTNQIKLISSIIEKLLESRENGSRIFMMGNGGSSSTASHFTSDLLKTSITCCVFNDALILNCIFIFCRTFFCIKITKHYWLLKL